MTDLCSHKLYVQTRRYVFRQKYDIIAMFIVVMICISIVPPVILCGDYIFPEKWDVKLKILLTILILLLIYAILWGLIFIWNSGKLPGFPDMTNATEQSVQQLCPKTLQLILNNLSLFNHSILDEYLENKRSLTNLPLYNLNESIIKGRIDQINDLFNVYSQQLYDPNRINVLIS